ncbi:MAG: DUF721 domain-containing protein [Candidatus Dormibacteraeota bacterium]|nr:DUF721 domain-containing protein [Candidatus Dormibacteraeota bacterium]
MDRFGNVLEKVLSRQPGQAALAEARIRLAFAEILGPDLAGRCEQISVRGQVVSIVTSNPALAHQLRLDSEELLRRLNETSRLRRRVRELRVRVGRPGPVGG